MTLSTLLKIAGLSFVVLIAGVVLVVTAVFFFRSQSRSSPAVEASRDRLYICAETGKSFHYRLEEGVTASPVRSPFTGRDTGYPAELCYWTPQGKPKETPDAVLLNGLVGKPGPTFCPACGRMVVAHNPRPSADRPAPPTEAEYNARRSGQ